MQLINLYLPTPALSGSGALQDERVKLKAKSSARKLSIINSHFSTIRWVYSQPVFVFDFANKAPLLMQQIYRKIDILVQPKNYTMKSTMLRLKPDFVFPLLISVILTLYAFYVDEGKYNFTGILEFTNLFFLGVYVLLFFGIQKLIQIGLGSLGLTKNISLLLQTIVSSIVLVGLLIAFFISVS